MGLCPHVRNVFFGLCDGLGTADNRITLRLPELQRLTDASG